MALVTCKECKNEISDSAAVCPQCGAKPQQKTSIVTWIVGAILLVVVFKTCSTINEKNANRLEENISTIASAKILDVPCRASDFTVKNTKSRREYDNTILTATITNNGSTACGIEVKASTYDKSGAVVETKDFWPASIRNIEPGAGENFQVYIRADSIAKNFDLVPIRAKVWASNKN